MENSGRKKVTENPNGKNIAEGIKLDAVEMSLQKLSKKIFELEIFEKMARETEAKLRQKEEEVEKGKIKLEELEYENIEKMNDFCDRVWHFSSTNTLYPIFEKYFCPSKRKVHKLADMDCEKNPEIRKMRDEMEQLKNRLLTKNAILRSVDEKLMEARIELQNEEQFPEKDPEIIRLKTSIKKSEDQIQSLNRKIALWEKNKNTNESRFFAGNNLFDAGKISDCDFVTASKLIEESENLENKRPKFSVKKESAIAKKMANIRLGSSAVASKQIKFSVKKESGLSRRLAKIRENN